MNPDQLQKCIELLNQITEKFGLQTNIQIQCAKGNSVIIFIESLPSIAFHNCEYFLKYFDTIIQCIEMQSQISSMNNELDKILASMRG